MHRLPFGLRLTDALFKAVGDMADRCSRDFPEFIPGILPCTSQRGRHWGLYAIEKIRLEPGSIFTVDGVSLQISPFDQTNLSGSVLDWKADVGIVELGTQSI